MNDSDVIDEVRHLVDGIHMQVPVESVVARGRSRRRRRVMRLGAAIFVGVCALAAAGSFAARGDARGVRVEGGGSTNQLPMPGNKEAQQREFCVLRKQLDARSQQLEAVLEARADALAENPSGSAEVERLDEERMRLESEIVAVRRALHDRRPQRGIRFTCGAPTSANELPAHGYENVADGDGTVAGYVKSEDLEPSTKDLSRYNARTLLPVFDPNGNIVGYFPPALGFVSLEEASTPGWDVEDARAKHYGGCQPLIGDVETARRTQTKYPICEP